jgi:hypothetical protein
MFNQGDKYLHFTKYGGVNKGEVEWYGTQINWDTQNMVAYHIPYIKSTKGIVIHLNGEDGKVFKIAQDISEDMLKKLKSSSTIFAELMDRKQLSKVERTKDYLKNAKFKNEDGTIVPLEEGLKKYNNEKNNLS